MSKVLPFSFVVQKHSQDNNIKDTNKSSCNKIVTNSSNKNDDSNNDLLDFDNNEIIDNLLNKYNITLSSLDLPRDIQRRLFKHQKKGVCWLYLCHLKKSGGLLADDMGLGKTLQVTSVLTGLMRMKLIKSVLIISPVSVLESWHRELQNYLCPYVNDSIVQVISSDITPKNRIKLMNTINKSNVPHVIITSYSLMTIMIDRFSANHWDYVILDEAHEIKNSTTGKSKAVNQLTSTHRLILTGTPVQNNLNEFHTLIDWVTQRKLLGDFKSFNLEFIQPMKDGQDPKATQRQRQLSLLTAQKLLNLTRPIFLQRKKSVLQNEISMPLKTEVAVWIPLSYEQRNAYEHYLQSEKFKRAIKTNCTVGAISYLKSLCRHPLLIEASAVVADDDDNEEDLCGVFNNLKMNDKIASSTAANTTTANSNIHRNNNKNTMTVFDLIDRKCEYKEIVSGSIKLRVLLQLTQYLHRHGHRMLIFSQSKRMLDIIQRVLSEKMLFSVRIDGSVVGRDRQNIIDDFNSNNNNGSGPTICLLTTRACGYGITLTGADRVIIYDPRCVRCIIIANIFLFNG